MLKKSICIIGQFAPPMHGLSKALETICDSELNEKFELQKINITNNRNILKNIIKILKSKSDLYYFTISQTRGGNIRDLIILKLLEIQNKKCIVHLHGGYYRKLIDNDLGNIQKKLNYKAIKKLDGVIVLSESLKQIFKGMIDDNKIFTVPNCVDNKFIISNEEFNEKMKTFEKKEVIEILYLSNFIKSKGYEYILELVKLEKENCCINGKDKRLHFNFAGKFFEKEEEEKFFEYIKVHELENYVTYHGIVNGKDKLELLKKGDIFILLTRYPNEGQPISILEAMGNGMYIVTTDHAGIPDIVKDEINGFICKEENINLSIQYIYEKIHQNHINVMKSNRIEVTKNYLEEKYINNIENIFKNC